MKNGPAVFNCTSPYDTLHFSGFRYKISLTILKYRRINYA